MFQNSELYAKVMMALSKGQIVEIKLDGISVFYRLSNGYLLVSYSMKPEAIWMPLSEDFLIKATWKIQFHEAPPQKKIEVVYK